MEWCIVDTVKSLRNIRGIQCFRNLSEGNSIEMRANIFELKNNFTSDLYLQKEINDLNQKEMIDLKTSFETMQNQFEKRFIEQIQNLSSLNEKFMFYSTHQNRLIHGNESDSFQFAFKFLLMIVILFAFGLSIFLYCKLRVRSADPTLV